MQKCQKFSELSQKSKTVNDRFVIETWNKILANRQFFIKNNPLSSFLNFNNTFDLYWDFQARLDNFTDINHYLYYCIIWLYIHYILCTSTDINIYIYMYSHMHLCKNSHTKGFQTLWAYKSQLTLRFISHLYFIFLSKTSMNITA